MKPHVAISVGIIAHNEEVLIERVAQAYLSQRTAVADIVEIVIVSCSSTDRTDFLASRLASDHPRLRLVQRPERTGKLGAIQAFADEARGEVLVVAAGDSVPAVDAVEELVRPFVFNDDCGMTGPRVVSASPPVSLPARLHARLWELHHELARTAPKLGEVVAVRAIHLREQLPSGVHCDEVVLEARVNADHARLRYAPEAVVRNFAPPSLFQLYRQRRRIACQHLAANRYLHYRPASSRLWLVVTIVVRAMRQHPPTAGVIAGLVIIETLARLGGRLDFSVGKRYRTWTPAARPTAVPQVNTAAAP